MDIKVFVALLLLSSAAGASTMSLVSPTKNVVLVEPDGRREADSKTVVYPQVWSLRPWKKRCALGLNMARLSEAKAFSRNGKLVAFGCNDGTLRVFDARSGRLSARLGSAFGNGYNFPYSVSAVAFSPDGRTLASSNRKGLFLWNWRTGKLLFSRPLRHHMYYETDVKNNLQEPTVLLFSPDGKQVAVGGKTRFDENGHVFLLNIALRRFRHVWDIPAGDDGPTALAFSPGGNRLLVVGGWGVSASSYDQADLFDTRSGRNLWHVDNGEDSAGFLDSTNRFPDSAAFSSDGRRVAMGSLGAKDGQINFLEIRRASNGKLLVLRTDKSDYPSLEVQKRLRAELNVR